MGLLSCHSLCIGLSDRFTATTTPTEDFQCLAKTGLLAHVRLLLWNRSGLKIISYTAGCVTYRASTVGSHRYTHQEGPPGSNSSNTSNTSSSCWPTSSSEPLLQSSWQQSLVIMPRRTRTERSFLATEACNAAHFSRAAYHLKVAQAPLKAPTLVSRLSLSYLSMLLHHCCRTFSSNLFFPLCLNSLDDNDCIYGYDHDDACAGK